LTCALFAIDYLTGPELSFSIFYFLPIVLVTWSAGWAWGLANSGLATAAWLVAELLGGVAYSHDWIQIWNTLTRLGAFVVLVAAFSTLRTAVQTASDLARVDSLTGLSNIRAFREASAREILRARREGEPLSVVYVDVDNFKAVNDQFGHGAGDALLVGIGQRLNEALRRTDVAARLGGDEFAALLPATSIDAARIVADKLQRALARLSSETQYPIGFSIGVACFRVPPKSTDALLREADALMYAVKRSGKGAIRIAAR
jgi:diguanylate cyclase (GGDEF)-like protein